MSTPSSNTAVQEVVQAILTHMFNGNQEAVTDIMGEVDSGAQKAIEAEFESLARHINKGRQITTWIPRHITPRALSMMAEDLATDVPLDVAVRHAKAVMFAPKAAPPPNQDWPGWKMDVQLAQVYTEQIKRAFAVAMRQAAATIQEAVTGGLRTTVAEMTEMVRSVLNGQLLKVLQNLYREAWHLGTTSARGLTAGVATPDWGNWTPGDPDAAARYLNDPDAPEAGALRHLLHAQGISVIKAISSTRMPELQQAIGEAILHGDNGDTLAARIEPILHVKQRAGMIATTETARAVSAATKDTYQQQGIDRVTWEVAPDERVCRICEANRAAGPNPRDTPFPSGDLYPPAHPWCRCALVPASVAGVDINDLLGPLPAVIPDTTKGFFHHFNPAEARNTHGEWTRDEAANPSTYLTLYHGTTKENAESIFRTGFRKPQYAEDDPTLTPDKRNAQVWAYDGNEDLEWPAKPGYVAEIHIPKDQADEYIGGGHTAGYTIRKPLPPEFIHSVTPEHGYTHEERVAMGQRPGEHLKHPYDAEAAGDSFKTATAWLHEARGAHGEWIRGGRVDTYVGAPVHEGDHLTHPDLGEGQVMFVDPGDDQHGGYVSVTYPNAPVRGRPGSTAPLNREYNYDPDATHTSRLGDMHTQAAALNAGKPLDTTPDDETLKTGIGDWTSGGNDPGWRNAPAGDEALRRAVAAAPPNAPALYRGLAYPYDSDPQAAAFHRLAAAKPGYRFKTGMASWSDDSRVAHTFAAPNPFGHGSDPILLKMDPGSRSLNIQNYAGPYKEQQEWVSQGSYIVTSNTHENGLITITAKQAPLGRQATATKDVSIESPGKHLAEMEAVPDDLSHLIGNWHTKPSPAQKRFNPFEPRDSKGRWAFYHGTNRLLQPGDLLTPDHAGDGQHVYMTTDPHVAAYYAGQRDDPMPDGPKDDRYAVYQVEPTGQIEEDPTHAPDRKDDRYEREPDYRSAKPLRVVRRLPYSHAALRDALIPLRDETDHSREIHVGAVNEYLPKGWATAWEHEARNAHGEFAHTPSSDARWLRPPTGGFPYDVPPGQPTGALKPIKPLPPVHGNHVTVSASAKHLLDTPQKQEAAISEAIHAANIQARYLPGVVARTRYKFIAESGDNLADTTPGVINIDPSITYAAGRNNTTLRRYQQDMTKGWFVPADKKYSPTDQTIAHETGHALIDHMRPEDVYGREVWTAIAKTTHTPLPKGELGFLNLSDWLLKNRGHLRKYSSGYATSNLDEFVAELWAGYTTETTPTPLAKTWGDWVMAHATPAMKEAK